MLARREQQEGMGLNRIKSKFSLGFSFFSFFTE